MLKLKVEPGVPGGDCQALQEVIPYIGFVRPGLMLNKDGSLLAVFTFEGADVESVDQDGRDSLAGALDHAFRAFDGRVTCWWTVRHAVTTEFPGGEFAEPCAARLNDLHRAKFTRGDLFINEHYLSVLYSPDAGVNRFIEKVAFHMNVGGRRFVPALLEAGKDAFLHRHAFAFDQSELELQIRRFEALLETFTGAATMLRLRRRELGAMLAFLHDMVCPASAGQPVAMPSGQVVDGWIGDNQVTVGGEHMHFDHPTGSRYLAALSVKDWPEATRPGLFEALLSVPGEMVVSHMFRFLDHEDAQRRIQSARRHFMITQKDLVGHIKEAVFKTEAAVDPGKLELLEDAERALAALTGESLQYGYYNLTVLALGHSQREADETLKAVASAINRQGFLTVRERMNLFSAWAGTLPGQWAEQPRKQLVSVPNLSDIAPVLTLAPGSRVNRHLSEQSGNAQPALTAFRTGHAMPYWFNLHQGDLGHAFVIGPAGSGKSVFVNFLLAQYQKYKPVTVIFDKNRSCRIPTILQGGTHIDVVADEVALNPLSLLANPEARPWLARWIEMLIVSRGYKMRAEDEQNLWEGLETLGAMSSGHWNLISLASGMLSKELSAQLRGWCRSEGAMGRIFDNDTDAFSLADFTCVEMGDILQRYPRAAGAFMEYAFYRLDQKLDGRRPGIIYVEEAWFMLSDPLFTARLDDWLRTLRKRNTVVILATQSLSEIRDSSIFASIVDNVPTRVYLANQQARAHAEVYRDKFALSDAQIATIANAVPKQQYLLVNREHSRLLNVSFDPESLAMLRSDGRAQETFDRWAKSGQQDWKQRYVNELAAGGGAR